MFTEEPVDSYVSAKLSANAFNDQNYVVRVPFTTVSTNGIITEIAQDYPSIDPYVIQHSLELVKAKILELLKQGRSVDVLELGTLYLKPNSTVQKTDPTVSEMPSLTVKFRVNAATRSALSDVSISSFMISDPTPTIGSITSLYDGNDEGTLYQGYLVQLKGQNLKLPDAAVNNSTGNDETYSAIYIVPVQDDGTPNTDEAYWKKVTGYIAKNTDTYLQFYAPDDISLHTEYYIAVRSDYLTATTYRKVPLTGYSPGTVIWVAAPSNSGLSAPATNSANGELPSANTEATPDGEEF